MEKYLNLQEQLMCDPGYTQLLEEYRASNVEFLEVLASLGKDERQIIERYFGICAELHTKILLLACEL